MKTQRGTTRKLRRMEEQERQHLLFRIEQWIDTRPVVDDTKNPAITEPIDFQNMTLDELKEWNTYIQAYCLASGKAYD